MLCHDAVGMGTEVLGCDGLCCGGYRSQAKEGEQEDKEMPMTKWEPTTQGYIQFLVDSKHVFETMEALMKEASNLSCKCSSSHGQVCCFRERS